jgi:hypothetical protein
VPTTFSNNLGLTLVGDGLQSGVWGQTTNLNLGTLLEQAISGYATQVITDGADTVITIPDGATGAARNMYLELTGTLTATRNLVVPAKRKLYFVYNNTTGGFAVTVRVAGQPGIAVPAGQKILLVCDGVDVRTATSYLRTVQPGTTGLTVTTSDAVATLGGTLALANGGTGATNAAGARTAIGASTIGSNLFTLANPGATTFPRFNPDNTISALDAASFRAAIGAGTGAGGGTVTSVAGTGSVNGLTLTGIVTSTGSLTLGGALTNVSLTSQVTGTLPIGNGGTGATTAPAVRTALGATTIGANLFTLANPDAIRFIQLNADNTVSSLDAAGFRAAIGAGTGMGGGSVTSVSGTGSVNGITLSGSVTSAGNLTLAGSLSGVSLTSQVAGVLPVANGGTGVAASTGSGSNVLSDNATLVSPTLNGTAQARDPLGGLAGVGVVTVPERAPTSNRSLDNSDGGTVVRPSPSLTALTLPAGLVNGTACVVINDTGGSITLTQGGGAAVYWYNGSTRTGPASRTLAYGGVAALRTDGTNWFMYGTGIT